MFLILSIWLFDTARRQIFEKRMKAVRKQTTTDTGNRGKLYFCASLAVSVDVREWANAAIAIVTGSLRILREVIL